MKEKTEPKSLAELVDQLSEALNPFDRYLEILSLDYAGEYLSGMSIAIREEPSSTSKIQ